MSHEASVGLVLPLFLDKNCSDQLREYWYFLLFLLSSATTQSILLKVSQNSFRFPSSCSSIFDRTICLHTTTAGTQDRENRTEDDNLKRKHPWDFYFLSHRRDFWKHLCTICALQSMSKLDQALKFVFIHLRSNYCEQNFYLKPVNSEIIKTCCASSMSIPV